MQQQPQLFGRTQQGVPGRGPVAHQAQEKVAGAVEQANQRPKDAHEHLHRARDHQRHLLRPLQRHALGHQLAQHHVQRHNQQEGQGDGDGMRHRRRPGNPHTDQQRLEKSGDGDLPQPAQRQAGHGNAQLHTGEDPVQILQQRLHHPRPAAAGLLQLLDARRPHRHQRELAGHEKPVGRHQRQHDKDIDQRHFSICICNLFYHHRLPPEGSSR